MAETKRKKKMNFIIILCGAAALVICAVWAISVYVYNENFGGRFESYEPLMLRMEDFGGLQRTRFRFPSDKGQMLTGYMYSFGEDQKGIIIIAHGFGGGGHNSYMDTADFFARNGYLVFAYDATGNDESEGKGVGGLPQGVIDLDHAISFVEDSGNFPVLPIMLFGHSWGAYSACAVLTRHPEVRAVIACSGFNASPDMFESEGRKEAGDAIALFMPFVKLHEAGKYGKYAGITAMDGFAASDAAVMVVHSKDDDLVPAAIGYDIYNEKYSSDPRFAFILLEDSGHSYVFDDKSYINAFNADFDDWLKTLDYDHLSEKNSERFTADKAEYIHKHLDREQWSHKLDAGLFERFLNFYDEHLKNAAE